MILFESNSNKKAIENKCRDEDEVLEEARLEFDDIDTNNDGKVTWAEMKVFILKEDPDLTQQEID